MPEADAATLLVLCEKSGTLLRFDPVTGEIIAEQPVGEGPFDLTRHPDGRRLYVSCRRGQEIAEVDAISLEVLRRFPLRGDPTGLAVSSDGRRLYAGVHSLDEIAVFDLDSGVEAERLNAGNGPQFLRRVPRSDLVCATNLLSNPAPPDRPCINEITVIDDAAGQIVRRIMLPAANIARQIALTSDGSLAIAAITRPKNLVPMTQVARGWVVTNGFALIPLDADTPAVQLLIDLPNRAYADPFAVQIASDDSKFYISAAGIDTVVAVDLAEARRVMDEALAGAIERYSDNLGLSRRYVTARVRVGACPQAMVISGDGRWLYVANRLDDSISVIDTATDTVARTLSIGQPPQPDRLLIGERLFNSAARTFQNQFGCVSCHPDNGFDGLRYDLESDGLGRNFVDNRSLRDVGETEPFKWIGSNPDIATQCGSRTAKWVVRTGWLRASQIAALTSFIHSIPPTVNPHPASDGSRTESQRRGKAVFDRTRTNSGVPISPRDQCRRCHAGLQFTNKQRFDVGTQAASDSNAEFDTAHLINVFESGPYLHDGRAATLAELWTVHNPDDHHGVTSDLTERQISDLVAYLEAIGPASQGPP